MVASPKVDLADKIVQTMARISFANAQVVRANARLLASLLDITA